jgi:hypothetical protein
MESIVNCPSCGSEVMVVMEPYNDPVNRLLEQFEKSTGIGKTEHFEGMNKCKCGKNIVASLHVTAGT